jgi:XTP/dITP diphosphohydrolase
MSDPPLLLSTRSAGKLAELRPLLREAGWQVIDLGEAGIAESPEEDGLEVFETFEENALAKARYFHRRSGLTAIADDSGLEVDALGGAPGVRSKRWSGRTDLSGAALDAANNARLLAALEGVAERSARYVCAAAWVEGGRERVARGTVEGRVTEAPKGIGGFGYDPYFFSIELGRTFGETTREEKEGVSHRGRAFRTLLELVVATR